MQEVKITQQAPPEVVCLEGRQPSSFNQKLSQLSPNQHSACQQCGRNGSICLQCCNRPQGENAVIKRQKLDIQPFTTKEVSPHQQFRKSAANQQKSVMHLQKETIEERRELQQSQVNMKIVNAKPVSKTSQLAQNTTQLSPQTPKNGQTGIEIRFVINKPKNKTPIQTGQPVFKLISSQTGQAIKLQNLRQTQVHIPTIAANTKILQKQEVSSRLHKQPLEITHMNLIPSQVRFRAQSHPKISSCKSVYDKKDSNYDKDFNINHISPLPLKMQKIVDQRSQIQKLISVGNSDRNPNPYDFNLSDSMERSEVQHFHAYRLDRQLNINEQIPKKQLPALPEVLQVQTNHIQEKPTQKTESQSFEIKKYLQDADWLAHMEEVEEGKEVKYIITFMLQFIFIYFNLHFSLKTPKGQCIDSSHGLDFFILRPWLLGSALADAALTIIMLIIIILYLAKFIHTQKFLMFEHLARLVWVGKMLLWTLALTALILQSLKGSCSADILAFGIGSIVIQTIILVILLVRKCEQPDEQNQLHEQS